ncbi:TetR/AcrR family transcriptional regulator [Prauserella rugosa]|uniref:TetR family transcriptional regulator n=1 Tax=Prauserella rugosa TaxID=43354 RepID=A0A660CET8_9PSEU|nr:TetR/AcrR family transcriptional regulator [Prauserella rugosa]KMS87316.1 TetR family transcriptional regulator [Streptomyces regensis]TWH20924.1 TetR family transcriptional regulator [Prauserella rugosa]
MDPERHTRGGSRVSDDTLLDAARACVLTDGVRRTTLTGIAKAAGVSRMTVYRRFPDVRSVLAALMTREFSALLQGVADDAGPGGSARSRLVEHAVTAVQRLGTDPLLRTVLDLDADLLLPYITERLGATQRVAEDGLRAFVEQGHADGSIRAGEPAAQARALLLVLQSFVLSRRPAVSDSPRASAVDAAALLGELAQLLEGALKP